MKIPDKFADWHALEMYGDEPEKYVDRITHDFETIKPWLPKSVKSILDIGSGLAGVNVLLARETKAKTINLIDGNGTGPRKMGYVENTTAWFDVNMGAEFIRKNTSGLKINCFAPDAANGDAIVCDLLISLKSWAHHYSAKTYIDLARRSLQPGGRMVVDVRNGSDGLAVFAANGFGSIGVAYETAKAQRHVFERLS